ncbi:MAG: FAD-binding protein [Lachnospiraceae bacterium]|nr:FAD-binding protein [Lachnospiraceae bacterium]
MRICVNNLKFHIDHEPAESDLANAVSGTLKISSRDISDISVLKKSIDARHKDDIRYIYSVECDVAGADRILNDSRIKNVTGADRVIYSVPEPRSCKERPVIAGFGPAGMFCAYILVLAGVRPIVIERGESALSRKKTALEFWETGLLKPDSNVQFGEGGAGAFSDGKLNTLIKDKTGRCRFVLETLVKFGAPANILYDSKPHVGTDILIKVVTAMREFLLDEGCEIRFDTRITDLIIESGKVRGVVCESQKEGTYELEAERVILAIGHSARDTFEMLNKRGVHMESKPFAVGLRVEHPREFIDISQYGEYGASRLPAASYKLTAQASNGRGVYSFCMCPGGYVVNASSEDKHLAVNGMSYSGRSGDNSNSAIIVTVTPDDFPDTGALSGVAFQRDLELKAYDIGNGKIPYQRYGDYVSCLNSVTGLGTSDPVSRDAVSDISFAAGFAPAAKGMNTQADISTLLPPGLSKSLIEGMSHFGHKISGFNSKDAYLSGIESRTSSPVKIPRRDDGMSVNTEGLYPCGEGAGYAGGITSAAMDGMYIAEELLSCYPIK